MRFLRNTPIRRKLTVVTLLTSGAVLLVAAGALFSFQLITFRQGFTRDLSVLADVMANNSTAALTFEDREAANEILAALRAKPSVVSAWIRLPNGTEFARYGSANNPADSQAMPSDGFRFESGHLLLGRPIWLKQEWVGTLYVQADYHSVYRELFCLYLTILAGVLAVSFILALLLSSRLQRFISEPILRLADTARVIAEKRDYSVRAEQIEDDELAVFTNAFNQMLTQIQAQDADLQEAHRDLGKKVKALQHEIAERQQAEVALRESQAVYHSLVEELPSAVFRKDATGRYVFVNSQYCRLKRMKAGDFLGKTPVEVASAELAKPEKERGLAVRFPTEGEDHHELIMRTGETLEKEEEYPGADGGTLIMHAIKTPVFDADGRISGTQGILFDITARRQAEAELRHERNLFHTVLDNLPSIVFFKDKDGRYVLSNRAHQRALGATRESLVGKTGFEFHPSDLARQYQEEERRIMRSGEPQPPKEELALNRELGEQRWHLTSRIPFKDEEGQVAGIVGISHDITERKRAEEALRESQALYHSLVEQMPAGIFRKDQEGRYVLVNSWFCQLRGMKGEEILGKTSEEMVAVELAEHGGTRPEITRLLAEGAKHHERIMRNIERIEVEEEHSAEDGKKRFLRVVKSPVRDPDGKIVGTQGVQFDITALKQAEEELRRAQVELLEVSRRAGMAEVATGVLHNVGNVLNSLNISVTLMRERLQKSQLSSLPKLAALLHEHESDLGRFLTSDPKGKLIPNYVSQLARYLTEENDQAQQIIDSVAQNVEHIKEIVAMQQSYARVCGAVETVSAASLLEDALLINATGLERRRIRIVREFASVPPVTVHKHRVLQILINLVRNAEHALTDNGHNDKVLRLGIATNGDGRFKITVTDNGVGIEPENLKRIFSHGFTTKTDGHGFGLHSGATAAQELGGCLTAHSDGPGRGATFTLELPINHEKQTHEHDQPTSIALSTAG